MIDEQREQRRVDVLIEVRWNGPTGSHEARASDISPTGCFVDTIVRANVGEEIHLNLRLPAGDWIEVQGVVTYGNANTGFGVKFIDLSESAVKQLQWLVKAEIYKTDKQG